MYGLPQIFLASASLFTMGAAISLENRGHFSVTQKYNSKFMPNGPAAYAKAFNKFNKPMPHDLSIATGKNGSITVTRSEWSDEEYLCPVDIGGQTLHLLPDTGSAELWLFSTSLPPSEQSGHTVFDPSKSRSFQVLSGYKWNISYYNGELSASGTVGTDIVTVGGISVSGQAVEIARSVSPALVSNVLFDGLLGLAFSSLNRVIPKAQPTFFDTVNGSLSSPVFTVDLHYHAPGTFDFGIIDPSKYTDAITYVHVNASRGLWEFTGSGYAVGNHPFESSSIDAIADTGTPFIYLPDAAVTAYYSRVSGASYNSSQGGFTFPCSTTLPDLTLGIGSYRAIVPGKYISYGPHGASVCFGGIQSNVGIGFSIYGYIFLTSQFVIFDGSTTPRLGFAAKST